MEIIVAVIVIGLLVGVLLPQLGRTKRTTQLSQCKENLKQVVLAHLLWVNDHERIVFPGQISTNDGGTKEHLQKGELSRHYQCLSNELVDPTVLVCPSDNRKAARNFSALTNMNSSYFLNGDIGPLAGGGYLPPNFSFHSIGYIALGDRNVTNSVGQKGGIIVVDCDRQIGWDSKMHNKGQSQNFNGNVAYADGSVSNLTSSQLQQANNVRDWFLWSTTSPPAFRFFLP